MRSVAAILRIRRNGKPGPGNPGDKTPGGRGSGSDRDGEGLPDDWERQHNLDYGNPGDAGWDPDGDGRAKRAEYEDGGDPRGDDVAPGITVPGPAIVAGPTRVTDLGQLDLGTVTPAAPRRVA